MSNKDESTQNQSVSHTEKMLSVFGAPPVLPSEDDKKYWQLAHELRFDVEPKKFKECIWLRDIVDLTWDILRLRRFKSLLIRLAGKEYSSAHLQQVTTEDRRNGKTFDGAAERQQYHNEVVETHRDFHCAEGFASCLDTMERIEWLLVSAEKRRNDTFREIEFHRELAAVRMRQTSDKFIAQEEHAPLAPTGDERAVEIEEVIGGAGDGE